MKHTHLTTEERLKRNRLILQVSLLETKLMQVRSEKERIEIRKQLEELNKVLGGDDL